MIKIQNIKSYKTSNHYKKFLIHKHPSETINFIKSPHLHLKIITFILDPIFQLSNNLTFYMVNMLLTIIFTHRILVTTV